MAQTFHQLASYVIGKAVGFMGETFTFRGVEYTGVINEMQASQDPEAGGFRAAYVMTIYVKKLGFPTPQISEKLTARGRTLRITSIQTDAISYSLGLNDPNR